MQLPFSHGLSSYVMDIEVESASDSDSHPLPSQELCEVKLEEGSPIVFISEELEGETWNDNQVVNVSSSTNPETDSNNGVNDPPLHHDDQQRQFAESSFSSASDTPFDTEDEDYKPSLNSKRLKRYKCSQLRKKHHKAENDMNCPQCYKTFSDKLHLNMHLLTHPVKILQCEICSRHFKRKEALNKHHCRPSLKKVKCEFCGKQFTRNATQESKECNQCSEQGVSAPREKLVSCELCNKQFSPHALLRHQRTHSGEKPYECEICQKRFTRTEYLLTHKNIHTGEKPYVCEMCGIQFTHNSTLICHRRLHTGEKPFKCDICNKEFSQNVLGRHRRTHSSEKPYKCELCSKQFTCNRYLVQHQQTDGHMRRAVQMGLCKE